MSIVIGWDVGGAHLKAARAENGRIVDAIQVASPLASGLSAWRMLSSKRKRGSARLRFTSSP